MTRTSKTSSNALRTSLAVVAVLACTPAVSLACSCWGTQSIGNALTTADAVIVGKVERHMGSDFTSGHQRPAIIQVEVVESLKGGIKGNIEIAKTMMCYQSFPEDDFQIGKSYVFPLERIDLANADQSWELMIDSDSPVASYKLFRLPVCSHNALWVDGQGLYTNELTSGGGRRLEYYMPLPLMKVLLPVGLLSVWGVLAFVGTALVVAFVLIRRRRRKSVDGG